MYIHTYIHEPGEPLWLSGKVVENEKINEIKRTRDRSPPQATSLKNTYMNLFGKNRILKLRSS
jgi:hypothetical protein